MEGSTISVHVIKGDEVLKWANNPPTSVFTVEVDGKSQETKVVEETYNPKFDQVLVFDVTSGTQPVRVKAEMVTNGSRESIGTCEIDFKTLAGKPRTQEENNSSETAALDIGVTELYKMNR